MDKYSKNSRTLDLYVRFCEGKTIHKAAEAERFGVNERSVQRDIDDIRAFLEERGAAGAGHREIIYDRSKKGLIMTGTEGSVMSNSEILAVAKILLESRAFTKEEMDSILNKLVEECVPLKNMQLVSELIANEKYHYVELHHKSVMQDKLWNFAEDIKEHEMLEIDYSKRDSKGGTIRRIIEPVSILFSEYYFYLNAYIVEKNQVGKYIHKYDYPAIFRLDRIESYRKLDAKFRIPYASRFEEGEFRKRVQFMYPGELMKIRVKYFDKNPEPVLDRLPTAEIVEQFDDATLIEAEVYGKGIIMWLLSQGNRIEVVYPESLRQEIKKQLMEMLERYSV